MTGRGLLVAAGVAMALTACSEGPPNAQGAKTGRIALTEFEPRPAPPVDDAARELRATLLGPDALDPARVSFWWFGVSSFIVSAGGHLFLLDAWEPVGLQQDYVPIGREELAALRPEAIFIGHGHFDHAADAGYIAGRSGALVVGSEEICTTAKEDAAEEGMAENFDCLVTGTMDAPEPGTVQSVQVFADLPPVQILQHIHSAATEESHDPGTPFIHVPDLLPFVTHLNTSPAEYQRFFASLPDPQGGTWAYHFRVGDFSFLWHDSAGPINRGSHPFAEAVQAALDGFPDCVDVQLGAIVGFNQPINGLRDPRLYVANAHPKVFLPTHHDAWAPVAGGGAASYEAGWRAELDKLEHPPELDYLRDPEDYLQPRRYRVADPRWQPPMPGSRCAREP